MVLKGNKPVHQYISYADDLQPSHFKYTLESLTLSTTKRHVKTLCTYCVVRVAMHNNICRNRPSPAIYLQNSKFPVQMSQQSTHRVHRYKVRNQLPINSSQCSTQQYATVQNKTLTFLGEPLCTTNCRQGHSFFQPSSGCLLFHFRPIVALALLNTTTYLAVPKLTARQTGVFTF